jgi:hypothetical protein
MRLEPAEEKVTEEAAGKTTDHRCQYDKLPYRHTYFPLSFGICSYACPCEKKRRVPIGATRLNCEGEHIALTSKSAFYYRVNKVQAASIALRAGEKLPIPTHVEPGKEERLRMLLDIQAGKEQTPP